MGYLFGVIAFVGLAAAPIAAPAASTASTIDFGRDVRPILSRHCFQCHGPDDGARKGDLRLDERTAALADLPTGSRAVVPFHPDESELLERVASDDAALAMPPRRVGAKLGDAEIGVLRTWIAQGASYSRHWAYMKPVRPALPVVSTSAWAANAIDSFALSRIDQAGLAPSPSADRSTLLRRVALDLTGLPPSPAELEEFLADERPEAYERAVDRMLAQPAFGERWGAVWLDLARYGDSQGYIHDPPRSIWRWRDWLVEALNRNLPYDQFTIEMLAGDLLPESTVDQQIATGFHRHTTNNTEGGANAEEFRHAAVVDRVNTTMQVWMGSTFACAQCHSHKYDPFSQREYYQLFAIFNATADNNSEAPQLDVAQIGFEPERKRLLPVVAAAQARLDETTRQVDALCDEWEQTVDVETLPAEVKRFVALPVEQRRKDQIDRIVAHHRSVSPEWAARKAELKAAQADLDRVATTTLVMQDGTPRVTHVALRGEFQNRGEEVSPGVPAALHPAPAATKLDRLELARWMVDMENPLTARVAVNRLWQELFGVGLVETSEEFGSQGDPPSHPELLDWLAVEFMSPTSPRGVGVIADSGLRIEENVERRTSNVQRPISNEVDGQNKSAIGNPKSAMSAAPPCPPLQRGGDTRWDVKRILKLIVTSATYCQSSQVGDELSESDPLNRLLARGPRVRLPAETVRDQTLFVAGLLSSKMYGPPVQPPQPKTGLTAAFGATTDWETSSGEDSHRRALYTRWRRNLPYPSMIAFDAPERSVCSTRRIRTNTPLQALVALNDPVYFEAAQALGRRILREGGVTDRGRAEYGFRLALSRSPNDTELSRIVALHESTRASLAGDPSRAALLATRPLGPLPEGTDVVDAAAWSVVGNVLLNLDEFLVKR